MVLALGWQAARLIHTTFQDMYYKDLIEPRLGHLIECPYPAVATPLRHGLMEASYTAHYSLAKSMADAQSGGDVQNGDVSGTRGAEAVSQLLSRSGPGEGDGSVAEEGAASVQDITFTATTSAQGTLLLGEPPPQSLGGT